MTTPKKMPATKNPPKGTAAGTKLPEVEAAAAPSKPPAGAPAAPPAPQISVGRIMHWRPRIRRHEGPGPFPAIVVQVDPLNLTAFLPGHTVQLDEENFAELHWPERIG